MVPIDLTQTYTVPNVEVEEMQDEGVIYCKSAGNPPKTLLSR